MVFYPKKAIFSMSLFAILTLLNWTAFAATQNSCPTCGLPSSNLGLTPLPEIERNIAPIQSAIEWYPPVSGYGDVKFPYQLTHRNSPNWYKNFLSRTVRYQEMDPFFRFDGMDSWMDANWRLTQWMASCQRTPYWTGNFGWQPTNPNFP